MRSGLILDKETVALKRFFLMFGYTDRLSFDGTLKFQEKLKQ